MRVHREQSIGFVTLANEARRNAMTRAMWCQIPDAFAQHDADPEVRVIVLRGAGDRAFISGVDIGELLLDLTQETCAAFLAVQRCTKPVVAMIHGFCMGAGVGLSACADLRFAAEDAVFAIPAARLGVAYPAQNLQTLVSLIGIGPTRQLFFTGKRLNAQEALGVRLLDGVLPKAELEPHVRSLAEDIARSAPLTLRAVKLALQAQAALTGKDAVEQAFQDCIRSQDLREGVQAFLEKRMPVFRGR